MSFDPTPEQVAIVEAAMADKSNLIINALAGAAKTTTLELISKALWREPILSIAFNKRIAEEMSKRLPGHVKAATINSIGHRVWMAVCSKRVTLDTKKNYNILKGIIDSLPRSERDDAYDTFSETLKGVALAKSTGYVPPGAPRDVSLVDRDSFEERLAEARPEASLYLVDRVLLESIKQAYNGNIDFDDQIYMPTLFGGSFPQFPLVMVDEAQDLSNLNHAMVKKLARQRLIAVGDPYQSIYAFRGAAINSMTRLRKTFDMKEMGLSVSFRCPIEIVKRAQGRAPHMQWAPWAKEGRVASLSDWSAEHVPDSAAIVCRNNAPLFKLAIALLSSGRGIQLVGFDIGPQMIRTMQKFGDSRMTRVRVLAAIDQWEIDATRKSKSATIADRADCFRVFAEHGNDLGEAIAYAKHLFEAQGPIQLLSGHKSKGLEWNSVIHLDPWRIPSKYAETEDERTQEANLDYVITTRAKDTLILADLEAFQ